MNFYFDTNLIRFHSQQNYTVNVDGYRVIFVTHATSKRFQFAFSSYSF